MTEVAVALMIFALIRFALKVSKEWSSSFLLVPPTKPLWSHEALIVGKRIHHPPNLDGKTFEEAWGGFMDQESCT